MFSVCLTTWDTMSFSSWSFKFLLTAYVTVLVETILDYFKRLKHCAPAPGWGSINRWTFLKLFYVSHWKLGMALRTFQTWPWSCVRPGHWEHLPNIFPDSLVWLQGVVRMLIQAYSFLSHSTTSNLKSVATAKDVIIKTWWDETQLWGIVCSWVRKVGIVLHPRSVYALKHHTRERLTWAQTNLDKGSQAVEAQYPKGPLCQEWLNKF